MLDLDERRVAATGAQIGKGLAQLVVAPLHAVRLQLTLGVLESRCTSASVSFSVGQSASGLWRLSWCASGLGVSESYADLVGEDLAQSSPLTTFGLIAARDQNRPVGELSVRQQRRLALAVLLARPPQILLLDEPTNHFSLDLVTALEDSFDDYPGTLVVASHDRWLRRRWGGGARRNGSNPGGDVTPVVAGNPVPGRSPWPPPRCPRRTAG
ncbi:ATP-binding cassette domain-containing protein [Acidipropionibacterium timonense]|uniref:ATP-binding cassette domain-containing protein n=1 Tax=Acidipropionibacterium timonense TaxID=2161818 RepID=UPI00103009B8|nr:ATP-binding cassette domain-containing protein [Acidipropionibacterium timonense]